MAHIAKRTRFELPPGGGNLKEENKMKKGEAYNAENDARDPLLYEDFCEELVGSLKRNFAGYVVDPKELDRIIRPMVDRMVSGEITLDYLEGVAQEINGRRSAVGSELSTPSSSGTEGS